VLTRTPGWFHDGQYVPQILEEDVLAIQNLYQASGFLDVTVEQTVQAPADLQPVVIHLKITEGPQTMVGRVTLEGLKVIPVEGVLKKIRIQEGRPFSYGGLRNDEKQIAMMVSEKGYPYVQVSGDAEISEDRSEAWVLYQVTQNSYIKRGKTFYSGNFRTKKRILDRELIMRDGDPFSLRKMLRGQQNIRSMNIFRSVAFRPVGLKEKAETIHIFTELEEEKPFYFEASGGYETEKGLFGTSTVGDHNFFGLNKDFKINGEISEVGSRVESRIFDPRLFSTRVSADAGVFSERSKPFNQTFGTDTRGFDLVFSREWKKRIKSWLGFYYEVRENFVRDSQVEEDETFDPRGILMVKPSISYDSRDNFMNPKEGIFMLFGIDISRGVVNSLDDFYKYRCDLRGYTTPINRLTLAARGSFGKIDPYGSEGNIPPDQLFFLGGANNVRGFDENLFLTDENGDPVGGRLMAVGNIETRIDLGSNFEASFFWDVGYLDETFMSYQSENVRYSTGVGLRYVTPVGAVGVVYGHKLNPEPDESPGRLHFSIGYTF
ncbi:MAG: BamA/TamA family outer membrane protein, partial [Deltaproteobacteria bacterium]